MVVHGNAERVAIARVIWTSGCEGVGSPLGWLCTSQPRYEFLWIFDACLIFEFDWGMGSGSVSCSIVTNLGMHSESSSAIDGPTKTTALGAKARSRKDQRPKSAMDTPAMSQAAS